MIKFITWFAERLKEPSSSAGLGTAILGATQLAASPTAAIATILTGAVAFLAKEKGGK